MTAPLQPSPNRRRARGAAGFAGAVFATLSLLFLAAAFRVVPDPWNPLAPLRLDEGPTPVTPLKLRLALLDPARCPALLAAAATPLPDRAERPGCELRGGVRLARLSAAALRPVETRCGIALRLWFWERAVQAAAEARLGAGVAAVEHLSSHVCRPIRTPDGEGARLSRHATGEAIDVAAFVLTDGRRIAVRDWRGGGAEADFLHAVHRAACRWFPGVLGPDYNALHADHFHFESGGWTFCR